MSTKSTIAILLPLALSYSQAYARETSEQSNLKPTDVFYQPKQGTMRLETKSSSYEHHIKGEAKDKLGAFYRSRGMETKVSRKDLDTDLGISFEYALTNHLSLKLSQAYQHYQTYNWTKKNAGFLGSEEQSGLDNLETELKGSLIRGDWYFGLSLEIEPNTGSKTVKSPYNTYRGSPVIGYLIGDTRFFLESQVNHTTEDDFKYGYDHFIGIQQHFHQIHSIAFALLRSDTKLQNDSKNSTFYSKSSTTLNAIGAMATYTYEFSSDQYLYLSALYASSTTDLKGDGVVLGEGSSESTGIEIGTSVEL